MKWSVEQTGTEALRDIENIFYLIYIITFSLNFAILSLFFFHL